MVFVVFRKCKVITRVLLLSESVLCAVRWPLWSCCFQKVYSDFELQGVPENTLNSKTYQTICSRLQVSVLRAVGHSLPLVPVSDDDDDDCFYIALFSALKQTYCACMWFYEWLAFHSVFLNIHQSGILTALAWLVPHETVAILVQVLCTPYNHASCHFMRSHIRKVYACLAVFSCNLPPALLAEWLGSFTCYCGNI